MFTLHDLRDASREALGGGFRCREAAELFSAALGISPVDAHIEGLDPLTADARERTRYVVATDRLRSTLAREEALRLRESEVSAREADAADADSRRAALEKELERLVEEIGDRTSKLAALEKREETLDARETRLRSALAALDSAGLLPRGEAA